MPGGVDTSAPSQSLIMEKESACGEDVQQEEQFETVVFANSMPDVNPGQICPSSRKQNKRKRPYCHDGDESYNLRREFLDGEREKTRLRRTTERRRFHCWTKLFNSRASL